MNVNVNRWVYHSDESKRKAPLLCESCERIALVYVDGPRSDTYACRHESNCDASSLLCFPQGLCLFARFTVYDILWGLLQRDVEDSACLRSADRHAIKHNMQLRACHVLGSFTCKIRQFSCSHTLPPADVMGVPSSTACVVLCARIRIHQQR